MTTPSVLFVCVHNTVSSQMAAGYLATLSRGAVEVRSAGSMPAEEATQVAVEAMARKASTSAPRSRRCCRRRGRAGVRRGA